MKFIVTLSLSILTSSLFGQEVDFNIYCKDKNYTYDECITNSETKLQSALEEIDSQDADLITDILANYDPAKGVIQYNLIDELGEPYSLNIVGNLYMLASTSENYFVSLFNQCNEKLVGSMPISLSFNEIEFVTSSDGITTYETKNNLYCDRSCQTQKHVLTIKNNFNDLYEEEYLTLIELLSPQEIEYWLTTSIIRLAYYSGQIPDIEASINFQINHINGLYALLDMNIGNTGNEVQSLIDQAELDLQDLYNQLDLLHLKDDFLRSGGLRLGIIAYQNIQEIKEIKKNMRSRCIDELAAENF